MAYDEKKNQVQWHQEGWKPVSHSLQFKDFSVKLCSYILKEKWIKKYPSSFNNLNSMCFSPKDENTFNHKIK